MIDIGNFNTLKIDRETSVGLFLQDDSGEDVLLPNKYCPEQWEIGDEIEVFIYNDSEDRIIATNITPLAKLGDFAYLKVRDVSSYGAFLDWGLEKDMFVPFKEQAQDMVVGSSYLVHIYFDEDTGRLAASAKYHKFAQNENIELEEGEEVDLLIGSESDLGVNVVINNKYEGLLYKNELFKIVFAGDRLKGFVKKIREDNKIDVSLEKQGFINIEPNAKKILEKLKSNDGFLNLTDKSDPVEIKGRLEMSKKTFKKAIGTLYKQRLIVIEEKGIRLL